ncbi:hypothetical protein [Massilia cavernae]|uniref:hypothetical protein n=1 Tax=Massilia cavernae TaxID=2320864 RepID=UPI001C726C2F|nr:hypothetical protein [Massilia cavernae]
MHRTARSWLLSTLVAFALPALAVEPVPVATHDCVKASGSKVGDEGFVPIGGIEQWITVSGANCNNPIILFIHGGPGNPLSPYAHNVYGAWEKDFTLVQ